MNTNKNTAVAITLTGTPGTLGDTLTFVIATNPAHGAGGIEDDILCSNQHARSRSERRHQHYRYFGINLEHDYTDRDGNGRSGRSDANPNPYTREWLCYLHLLFDSRRPSHRRRYLFRRFQLCVFQRLTYFDCGCQILQAGCQQCDGHCRKSGDLDSYYHPPERYGINNLTLTID